MSRTKTETSKKTSETKERINAPETKKTPRKIKTQPDISEREEIQLHDTMQKKLVPQKDITNAVKFIEMVEKAFGKKLTKEEVKDSFCPLCDPLTSACPSSKKSLEEEADFFMENIAGDMQSQNGCDSCRKSGDPCPEKCHHNKEDGHDYKSFTMGYEDGHKDGYEDGLKASLEIKKLLKREDIPEDKIVNFIANAHLSSYDAAYKDGYEDGRGSGYDEGYDEGYDDGYDFGFTCFDNEEELNNAYNNGYNAGFEAAGSKTVKPSGRLICDIEDDDDEPYYSRQRFFGTIGDRMSKEEDDEFFPDEPGNTKTISFRPHIKEPVGGGCKGCDGCDGAEDYFGEKCSVCGGCDGNTRIRFDPEDTDKTENIRRTYETLEEKEKENAAYCDMCSTWWDAPYIPVKDAEKAEDTLKKEVEKELGCRLEDAVKADLRRAVAKRLPYAAFLKTRGIIFVIKD